MPHRLRLRLLCLALAGLSGCGDPEGPPDDVVSALAEHGDQMATALESLCPLETYADVQIVAVDLTNFQLSNLGLKRISRLTQFQRLYLSSPSITEAGFRSLADCPSLGTLWITGGDLDEQAWQALGSLKQLK